jgi:hypothetical protein
MSLLNGTRRALLTRRSGAFTGAYDDAYESSLVHVYEPARRVLTSYTGDLVCLRRDSDDAESDFGYDGDGNLDTAAIQNWLDADGASNAYVVTVYDQKGGDDVTQATKADQPLYVASLQNGRPGMRLDGSNHHLQGAFTNGGQLSQPFNVFVAAKLDATIVDDDLGHYIIDSDDTVNRMGIACRQQLGGDPDIFALYAGSWLSGSATDSSMHLFVAVFDSASSLLRIDGSDDASGNPGSDNADGITVGARFSGSDWFKGDILVPAIIADPALSAADRAALETAINAYWSIY